jgi:hypothetical protein
VSDRDKWVWRISGDEGILGPWYRVWEQTELGWDKEVECRSQNEWMMRVSIVLDWEEDGWVAHLVL